MSDFRSELSSVLNRHSRENGSDTPDYILADYLANCLDVFDKALKRRSDWYTGASVSNAIEQPNPPQRADGVGNDNDGREDSAP